MFFLFSKRRVLDVTSWRLASKGWVDPVSNAACDTVFAHRCPGVDGWIRWRWGGCFFLVGLGEKV